MQLLLTFSEAILILALSKSNDKKIIKLCPRPFIRILSDPDSDSEIGVEIVPFHRGGRRERLKSVFPTHATCKRQSWASN